MKWPTSLLVILYRDAMVLQILAGRLHYLWTAYYLKIRTLEIHPKE